jgi:hypothetical protein
VLQDFRFSRVGGHAPIDVDARVIAATSGTSRKRWRTASSAKISAPPQRGRDPGASCGSGGRNPGADHVSRQIQRTVRTAQTLAPETLTRLSEHPWSGTSGSWRTSSGAWSCWPTASGTSRRRRRRVSPCAPCLHSPRRRSPSLRGSPGAAPVRERHALSEVRACAGIAPGVAHPQSQLQDLAQQDRRV